LKTLKIVRNEKSMKPLLGKRAWITGASSGIGEATAKALATAGAEVVLSARRVDRLKQVAVEIAADQGWALIRPLDVAQRASVETLGKELDNLGGVDILINNAGVMHLSPLIKGRVDEWERIIDVNIKGVLYFIHAALPGMAARRSGRIVNISSVASRVTFLSSAVYCGSKFAVRAISDTLRKEGIRLGIRVTDIQPGAVSTELPASVTYPPVREAITAPGALYGPGIAILKAVDVANAVLYALCQPEHVDVSEILIRPRLQET
jgi:NADP-dependent 3-hydroxy acid dehydrogenase YdfG